MLLERQKGKVFKVLLSVMVSMVLEMQLTVNTIDWELLDLSVQLLTLQEFLKGWKWEAEQEAIVLNKETYKY